MYKEKLGISEAHELVLTNTKREKRKGQDTDIYSYDEKDGNGNLIACYVVRDSMCIYPPQITSVTYEKVDTNGIIIDTGTL